MHNKKRTIIQMNLYLVFIYLYYDCVDLRFCNFENDNNYWFYIRDHIQLIISAVYLEWKIDLLSRDT